MNTFLKLVDLFKDGKNTSIDLIVLLIAFGLAIIPIIMKLLKITSLNDFDRLFVPKNERGIQQFIVQIKDYILFSSMYIFLGIFFSLTMQYKPIYNLANGYISVLFIMVFGLSFFVILFKVVLTELLGKGKFNYYSIFSKILFNTNLYLGIYTFSLLFAFTPLRWDYLSFLLIIPVILLATYRNYHKKYDHEYICTTSSEEQFNQSMLIFKYSLEKDKMIFVKPDDNSFKEVYMFDKTANRFFKFTKVEIL
ncbi:MAG: hypothetical protein K0R18_540 [Bacillales bacterium]|jgi:hypothetical protein|nr:hypothetical protein [Bacillales bacterium]